MKLHNIDIEPNYEPLTAEEEMLLLNRVKYKSQTRQTGRRKISKKRIFVISLVAVFVFGVTFVFAASALGWDSPLVKLLNPKNEKQAEIISSAGMVVDKSVTKNGVTVTVKEVIGDRNAVYMTVDVTAPGLIGSDDIIYEFDNWTIETKRPFDDTIIYHIVDDLVNGSGDGWGYSREELSRHNDTISYLIIFESSKKIHDSQMVMTISNFGYSDEDDDDDDDYDYFTSLIDDTWEIKFKLNYTNNSVDLHAKEKIDTELGKLVLSKAFLSPISLSYKLDGSGIRVEVPSDIEKDDQDIGTDSDFISNVSVSIKMKDGTLYNPNAYLNGGSVNISNGTMIVNLVFDRILELDQVESLSIGDCVIDVTNLK
jgi:hypothetical protein